MIATPVTRYYCTYFNSYYIDKFRALVHSMEEHCGNFVLYCVCMDNTAYDYICSQNKDHYKPVLWSEYELMDDALAGVKKQRSMLEYFFTCTASICHYMLQKLPEGELLNYLDADMYFYATPEPIFKEMENKSIGIIAHRFWGLGRLYNKYGRFNVGWVSFRNDETGRNCVQHWREQCIDWCFDKLEDGKFADQKYLDAWPFVYGDKLKVIDNIGANVAPWNVGQYKLEKQKGNILINGTPLIFFHFASFKKNEKGYYISRCATYYTPMKGILRNDIYQPYVDLLEQNNAVMQPKKTLKRDAHTRSFKSWLKGAFMILRVNIYNDKIIPGNET